MKFTQHPVCNTFLGAPKGYSIEQCRALPILRVDYGDGRNGVVSFWKPNEAELKALNEGKCVALIIEGQTHAPVYLGVDWPLVE